MHGLKWHDTSAGVVGSNVTLCVTLFLFVFHRDELWNSSLAIFTIIHTNAHIHTIHLDLTTNNKMVKGRRRTAMLSALSGQSDRCVAEERSGSTKTDCLQKKRESIWMRGFVLTFSCLQFTLDLWFFFSHFSLLILQVHFFVWELQYCSWFSFFVLHLHLFTCLFGAGAVFHLDYRNGSDIKGLVHTLFAC